MAPQQVKIRLSQCPIHTGLYRPRKKEQFYKKERNEREEKKKERNKERKTQDRKKEIFTKNLAAPISKRIL